MRFIHEGTKLWTLFTTPRKLNTKFPSCPSDEFEDLPSVLILVKTKGLGCLPPFSLWDIEGLRGLSFLVLLKTNGCCYGVNGWNLSNTDDFELEIALLSLYHFQLLLSWCIMWVTAYLYAVLKFSLTGMTCSQGHSFMSQLRHPVSVSIVACH